MDSVLFKFHCNPWTDGSRLTSGGRGSQLQQPEFKVKTFKFFWQQQTSDLLQLLSRRFVTVTVVVTMIVINLKGPTLIRLFSKNHTTESAYWSVTLQNKFMKNYSKSGLHLTLVGVIRKSKQLSQSLKTSSPSFIKPLKCHRFQL